MNTRELAERAGIARGTLRYRISRHGLRDLIPKD